MLVTMVALIRSLPNSVSPSPSSTRTAQITASEVVESDPGDRRRRDDPVEREVGDRLREAVVGLAAIG